MSQKIVLQDDQLPMRVEGSNDRDAVIASVWLSDAETAEIKQWVIVFFATYCP
jgi:hypothetical protein